MTTWKTIEPSNTLNNREITHRRRSSSSCLFGECHCYSTVEQASAIISRYEIVTMRNLDKMAGLLGAGRYRALAILSKRSQKWLLEKSGFRQQGKSVGGQGRWQRCNTVYRIGLQIANSDYESRGKKSAHLLSKVRFARSRRFPPTNTKRPKFLE